MREERPENGAVLLIVVPKHPAYFLRHRESITIGRSKDNDLVILDKTVSRSHAIIKWTDRFPLLVDCDSTSGTCVDGKSIKHKHLHTKHTILLGDVELEAKHLKSESDVPTQIETPATIDPAIRADMTDSDDVILFYEYGAQKLEGVFKSTDELHQILKHLENFKRTGTLTIYSNTPAKIVFALGKIVSAECGKKTGLVALQMICHSFTNSSYDFSVEVTAQESRMSVSPSSYLSSYQRSSTIKRPRKPL